MFRVSAAPIRSGLVLEALASGLPIAGFPVATTQDVIGAAPVAVLDDDLRSACLRALAIPRPVCRRYAETMTWDASVRFFLGNLVSACNPATAPLSLPSPPSGRAEWGRFPAPRLWKQTPR
jgi:hypothetical protein